MKRTVLLSRLLAPIMLILLSTSHMMAQTMMPLPPANGSPYSGNVRGYWFIAPVSFTMTGLKVAPEAGSGTQSIQVMKIHSGGVAVYNNLGTNFTTLFYINGAPNNVIQTVSIPVNAGDTIGILGQASLANSYSATMSPSYTSSIGGSPVELTRFIYQGYININQAPVYSSEVGGELGRVEMYYTTASCSGQPTAGTVSSTLAVCPSNPFSITAAGATSGSGLVNQWQSRNASGTGIWTNITGATSSAYSSPGITSPTDYRYITTCTSNGLSDTSSVLTTTIKPANQCYCIPSNSNSTSYYISNFSTTGGITNITNNSVFSTTGYGDYTSTDTVTAMQGDSINLSVSSMLSSTYSYDIWIDWNQDGNFNGPNEHVLTTNGNYEFSPYTGTIAIPANALVGSTRMRVRNAYLNSPAPVCGSHDYGEAEDYTFTVIPSCSDPVVELGTDTSLCVGQTLTLDAGNPGLTYLWNDNSTNQTITVTGAGTYYVTVTDGSCSSSDTIVISEKTLPSADTLTFVGSGDCNFSFNVVNPQNVNSYSWDFGDGSPNETNATATHTYTQNGSYTVELTMTNDCGTSSQSITVECSGVGIQRIDVSNEVLKLYPNPTSGLITIENSSKLNMEYITAINILGQVVYQSSPQSAHRHQMDVSKLTSGIYTARIQTEKGMVIRKFEVLK